MEGASSQDPEPQLFSPQCKFPVGSPLVLPQIQSEIHPSVWNLWLEVTHKKNSQNFWEISTFSSLKIMPQ